MLWITQTGVWRSSEHLHLYDRLRRSYGDLRLVEEAPGHLFLDYEGADLVSFLLIVLASGWDAHLIPHAGHARVFCSRDEWVEVSPVNPEEVGRYEEELREAGAKVFRTKAG